jgi:hypothetical protein
MKQLASFSPCQDVPNPAKIGTRESLATTFVGGVETKIELSPRLWRKFCANLCEQKWLLL